MGGREGRGEGEKRRRGEGEKERRREGEKEKEERGGEGGGGRGERRGDREREREGELDVNFLIRTSWQQNITVDENKADRQWYCSLLSPSLPFAPLPSPSRFSPCKIKSTNRWFQTCTEFGYFQNAPAEGAIRSQFVNMTYHRTHCENVFGMV
jgi:hypothetical protein